MKKRNGKKTALLFAVSFMIILGVFAASVIKTNVYNSTRHHAVFSGPALFSSEDAKTEPLSVKAAPRGSTWAKIYDPENKGLTDFNIQAYTYDFTFSNNTADEIRDFSFTLRFNREVFLMSAWNGSLEVHQKIADGEIVSTVPDLREFVPGDHALRTVMVDGDPLIAMQAGDYFIYTPSASMNAMEMPIKPNEGTTPGFILYVGIGESIDDSVLELGYTFNRLLTGEPLFWISLGGLAVWLIAAIIFFITSAQIRKYNERHERDNEIINESIETFTSFIDAKDPYTNGHSKRVAQYTRLIAQKMGYDGEELDRIYYTALLHDCGKIGVPDNILGKPGGLTEEEYAVIKSHTVRGGEILHHFKSLENVEEGARYHHERYDGKGYPEGLAGEKIPLIARMICVADSFDTMNTCRAYKEKFSKDYILNEIETNKGRQFDPQIADIMLRLLRDGEIQFDV